MERQQQQQQENFGSKTLNGISHCVLSFLSFAHFILLFFLPRS